MSMEEWTGFSVPEPILEEASQWIAKLDAKHVSEQDRIAFTVWLASDPLHQTGYGELSDLWARSSVIKNFSHLVDESNVTRLDGLVQRNEPINTSMVQIETSIWPRFVALSLIVIGFLPPIVTTLL